MTNNPLLINFIMACSYALPIWIAVAFLTLAERKILSCITTVVLAQLFSLPW